ncbi:MAG: hypothetical protein AAGJ46_13175 [Planctomycetota bacterium]
MLGLVAASTFETWLTVGIVVHTVSAFACSSLAEEKFGNSGRAFLFGLALGPWGVLLLGRLPSRKPGGNRPAVADESTVNGQTASHNPG